MRQPSAATLLAVVFTPRVGQPLAQDPTPEGRAELDGPPKWPKTLRLLTKSAASVHCFTPSELRWFRPSPSSTLLSPSVDPDRHFIVLGGELEPILVPVEGQGWFGPPISRRADATALVRVEC